MNIDKNENKNSTVSLEDFQTGDILLIREEVWYSRLIEYFGYSKYSHVAMILKDPVFIDPSLTGLYVIESGYENIIDVTDGKIKFGVQVNKYEDFIEKTRKYAYYRKLYVKEEIRKEFNTKLKEIYKVVHNKPYNINPIDWIKGKIVVDHNNFDNFVDKKISSFWCSALIAYIYDKLGLIKDCPWSLVAPREFSGEGNLITFTDCNIGKVIKL